MGTTAKSEFYRKISKMWELLQNPNFTVKPRKCGNYYKT
ncbi:hypothetical protein LEP1GSC074_2656 [Leptospira noguchii str. Hook]|nr:hypothetical protein LEP1GSC074_2656 [Leptospira noguchii str. Hook]